MPYTLPDGYNPFEHLQSVFMLVQNRRVNEFYKDVDLDALQQITDIKLLPPEASLKIACLIRDDDNLSMMFLRLFLFYFVLGAINENLQFYGTPMNYTDSVEFHPQVLLLFVEKRSTARLANRAPIRSEISFRIMNETNETLTQAKVNTIKTAIQTELANTNFHFTRGTRKYSYRDPSKGYQFILSCPSRTEAETVVKKILGIQNHTYNDDLLTESISGKSFTTQPTKNILGELVKMPKQRPTGEVYFYRAELKVYGIPDKLLVQNFVG